MDSKCKSITFYLCSAFPNGAKKGKKLTKVFAENFKNCFSSKVKLKGLNLKFKAMGIKFPFRVQQDTVIEKIVFKKNEILEIQKYKSISKRASEYFNHQMSRVEIFAE